MDARLIINLTSLLIGLAANMALSHIILRNKRMLTRSFIIILNYCILNILGALLLVAITIMHYFPIYRDILCILDGGEIFYYVSSMLVMYLLTFDAALTMKTVYFTTTIVLIWAAPIILCVIFTILCSCQVYNPVYLITSVLFFTLTVLVFIRFIISCFRKIFNNPRLNLATLYFLVSPVEILEICGYSNAIFDYIGWILVPVQFLFPLIIVGYLYFADKNFRIGCLKALRCRVDVDSTVSFAENDGGGSEVDKFSVDINYSRANEDMTAA